MISVLHIGLPLEPPWLTPEDAQKIAARLAGISQRMEAAGFKYTVMHASPDHGLSEFQHCLRAEAVDAVLIGGGVAGNPNLATFKQQIIDTARAEAPSARVLDFDHSVDVPVLIARTFGIS
jgi:tRNA A37 threonylcarbamoyltransferase TsaD